jgi:hypothetical protein
MIQLSTASVFAARLWWYAQNLPLANFFVESVRTSKLRVALICYVASNFSDLLVLFGFHSIFHQTAIVSKTDPLFLILCRSCFSGLRWMYFSTEDHQIGARRTANSCSSHLYWERPPSVRFRLLLSICESGFASADSLTSIPSNQCVLKQNVLNNKPRFCILS